jgi:hypothetical protein
MLAGPNAPDPGRLDRADRARRADLRANALRGWCACARLATAPPAVASTPPRSPSWPCTRRSPGARRGPWPSSSRCRAARASRGPGLRPWLPASPSAARPGSWSASSPCHSWRCSTSALARSSTSIGSPGAGRGSPATRWSRAGRAASGRRSRTSTPCGTRPGSSCRSGPGPSPTSLGPSMSRRTIGGLCWALGARETAQRAGSCPRRHPGPGRRPGARPQRRAQERSGGARGHRQPHHRLPVEGAAYTSVSMIAVTFWPPNSGGASSNSRRA